MDSDPSPTDRQAEEAICRARAGDTEAFGVVVARYELPIRAWVASAGYPGVDVDEVTQRAFIAAFTNLHRYEEGTDLKAWLFAAAPWPRDAEVTCQKAMRAAGVEIDIERVQAGRVNCAAVLAGNKP
jgi:RNA polymerase sigma-70 factor (ECF subfamily)